MISTDLADKLSKLIPMLGSNQDGEIANAARMIKRALEAEKLDFHDLAAQLTRQSMPRQATKQDGSRPFNYADTFRESGDAAENTHPGSATSKFGLPIHDRHAIKSWPVVAEYCLKQNRSIPKAYGGKFLADWQIKVLKQIIDGTWPNNATAKMIETVLARCHQARDAQREAKKAA